MRVKPVTRLIAKFPAKIKEKNWVILDKNIFAALLENTKNREVFHTESSFVNKIPVIEIIGQLFS